MFTRKTKILAKIADNRCEPDFLKSIFAAGADVAWLNTAHQDEASTLVVVNNIRAVNDLIPIAIDTKGPEVRTKNIETPFEVKKGDHVTFTGDLAHAAAHVGKNFIPVSYPNFHNEIPVGEVVLYDDALIEFVAVEKVANGIKCVVNNSGLIKNKKSLNVPNVHIQLPALSEKDKGFIHFCAKHNIDYITHSFMRSADDIAEIKKITDLYPDYKPKIIAKIENKEGFSNVRDILKHCEGLMVARGDLGAEIGLESVPYAQKKMVEACLEMGKYCIVATQALESMIKNPRPTRAEVSDIANAVLEGTGAMSMSGETAYGDHPIEATLMMGKVMRTLEKQRPELVHFKAKPKHPSKQFNMAGKFVNKANKKKVAAIVALHCDIDFLRGLSAYRADMACFAGCDKDADVREIRLAYGVWPVPVSEKSVQNVISYAKYSLEPSDKVMVIEPAATAEKPNKKGYKMAIKAFKEVK